MLEKNYWLTRRSWNFSGVRIATPDDDLNQILIPVDGGPDKPFADPGARGDADVEVVFRDIEGHLLRFIDGAEAVVGCVAWLTNYNVLRTLAGKPLSLIVQKEDFLRPDKMSNEELKRLYGALGAKNSMCRYDFSTLTNFSYCGDPTIEPVRCVGNHNRDKRPSFPRMHNKFIIAGKFVDMVEKNGDYEVVHTRFKPEAVWTGSFNFSYNAGRSLENAVIIRDEKIAEAYLQEYEQIAAISEPLNWSDDWVAPEWRLGS